MLKKTVSVLLIGSLLIGAPIYANENNTSKDYSNDEYYNEEEYGYDDEEFTFEDEMKYVEVELSEADKAAAKILFDQAIAYEAKDDYDNADKVWNEFDELVYVNEYLDSEEEFTFEDEMKYAEVELSEADKVAAKILFDQALAYEAKDDFDNADKIWDEFDKLVYGDEYLDSEEEFTFEDEMKYTEVELSETDKVLAKTLFDKALAYEAEDDYDNADKAWNEFDKLVYVDEYLDSEEEFTFEDEMKYAEIELSEADKALAKTLFDKALAYEAEDDYENAEKIWDELYELVYGDEDLDSEEEFTFEDEMKYAEVDLSETDKAAAKTLFDKALAYEAKGDYENADKVWDEFDELVYGDDNLDIQAVYNIVANKIVLEEQNLSENINTDDHEKIWTRISRIVPNELKKSLTKIEFGTDGEDGLLAAVEDQGNLSKWSLFIDVKDSLDADNDISEGFNLTVIHELAHVITLNNTQFDNNSNDTYQTEEGITKENSYLNKFYNKFWKTKSQNEDDYVNEYASTSVEEDIAESFAVFVTEEKYKTNSVKSEKVNFFYNFKELVKMRTEIRNSMGM